MREKFDSLNPQKIIDDILKKNKRGIVNSSPQEKPLTKDDYLTNLKNNAMNNFIESERNKSLKEIRANFDEKLKEFQKATELYAEKKNKETTEIQRQLIACRNKNIELETTINHLNQESKLQKEQLKQYENDIFKLQTKFDVFEKLKPIFEEFFKEFPTQNPIVIIQDIKDKKEASTTLIEDKNELERKNQQLEIERNELIKNYQKKIQILENKIISLEDHNKDIAENYNGEIKELKSDLKGYEEIKKEKLERDNMLFQLYNKLIERLKLDLPIKDEYSMITEKDFTPNLFDNKEIMEYIKSMLDCSSEQLSSKMLRETIAYANMILRTYMIKKLKNRFNPVETFKEIKNFIDNLTMQLNDSDNSKKTLQSEVNGLNQKIKKLQNEIKYKQIQFEGLKKKYDLQINERIQKSRELRNQMIKNKEVRRNKIHNLKNNQLINNKTLENYESESEDASSINNAVESTQNNNISMSKNKLRANSAFPSHCIKEEKNEVFLTENNKDELRGRNEKKSKSRMKSGKSDLTTRPNTAFQNNLRPKSSLIGYYLTHNKFFRKENFETDSKINMENDSESHDISRKNFGLTARNTFKENKKLSDFNENLYAFQNYEQTDKIRNYDSEKYSMRFKNMIIAKNNDKLVKTGGFTVLPSHSDALKGLVNQTNQLFLYKQKVNPKHETKNIFNKFRNNIDKKFKILRGIKPDYKAGHFEMGENIVSDINAMIKDLEKKE